MPVQQCQPRIAPVLRVGQNVIRGGRTDGAADVVFLVVFENMPPLGVHADHAAAAAYLIDVHSEFFLIAIRLAVKLLAELPSSRLSLQRRTVCGERIADNGVDERLAAAVAGRDRHDGVPLARIVPLLLKVVLHRMTVDDLRDMRPRLLDDRERLPMYALAQLRSIFEVLLAVL